MRMLSLFFIWILLGIFAIGCIGLRVADEPKIGYYEYTHNQYHAEHVIREIPIWIDSKFGAADRIAISDAIGQWNYALNGYVELVVVDNEFNMEESKILMQVRRGGWLFMKLGKSDKLVPAADKPGTFVLGFTERIGGSHLYLVRDRLANEDVFGVTMHEIGHLLGSPHVGNRLMYPAFSRARGQCIDKATMEKVAEWQEIPMGGLNYCYDKDPTQKLLGSGDGGSSCPVEFDHSLEEEIVLEE